MKVLNLINQSEKFDYYTGDIHGQIEEFVHSITHVINISDANIFILGDIGLGFHKKNYYISIFDKVNKKLIDKNINLILFRGNHDNPSYFVDNSFLNRSNIFIVEDYTIVKTATHSTLCVGGARSIDKCDRWKIDKKTKRLVRDGWWEDERVKNIPLNFDEFINEHYVDVICTHCAPINVEYSFSDISKTFLEKDEKMIDEIKEDCTILYNIWEKIRPLYWFYGHYHKNKMTIINCTDFKCVNKFVAGYKPSIETIY